MTTSTTLAIASDIQVTEMLEELANPDGQYETMDYGPTVMDAIALERGFQSFTMRVERHGWIEMGHMHSVRGQYSLK